MKCKLAGRACRAEAVQPRALNAGGSSISCGTWIKINTWQIRQTLSAKSVSSQKQQPLSAIFNLQEISKCFPLPWSAYVRLLSVKGEQARQFYEEEALRGGWSVRQLDRQINSMFYERTTLSKKKAAILKKGAVTKPEDIVSHNLPVYMHFLPVNILVTSIFHR